MEKERISIIKSGHIETYFGGCMGDINAILSLYTYLRIANYFFESPFGALSGLVSASGFAPRAFASRFAFFGHSKAICPGPVQNKHNLLAILR